MNNFYLLQIRTDDHALRPFEARSEKKESPSLWGLRTKWILFLLNNFIVFQGYSRDLLEELYTKSQTTGVDQMIFLLEAMVDSKEVTEIGIVKRVKDIVKGMKIN